MARVLLFGRLSDIAGWRVRVFEPTPERLSRLKDQIAAEDPILGGALDGRGVRTAVDKVIVGPDVALRPGAEVAFLPPMSGG